MKMLQQTLKGMQEQLLQSRKQQAQDDQKIKDLTVRLNATKKEEPPESEIITLDKDDDISEEPRTPKHLISSSGSIQITQKDAKLIGNILIIFTGNLGSYNRKTSKAIMSKLYKMNCVLYLNVFLNFRSHCNIFAYSSIWC